MQGQAGPSGPERHLWEARVVGDQGKVGGEDGDEQEDESPGGGPAGCGKEDAEAAEHLGRTAEQDELARGREVARHDAHVGGGEQEVEGAGRDVEDAHDDGAGPGGRGYETR